MCLQSVQALQFLRTQNWIGKFSAIQCFCFNFLSFYFLVCLFLLCVGLLLSHEDVVQRKLPSPGFQVEVVLVDYDSSLPSRPSSGAASQESDGSSGPVSAPGARTVASESNKSTGSNDKDDVFSDNEAEESGSSKIRHARAAASAGGPAAAVGPQTDTVKEEMVSITHGVEQVTLKNEGTKQNPSTNELKNESGDGAASFEVPKLDSSGVSDFKAIAADASVFTFGDDDDYESE